MPIECKGVIFDLDGVITDTATIHTKAWKKIFDDFLREYSEKNKETFTDFDEREDYLKYVDGKPRHEGILSFLNSRGIQIPYGRNSDKSLKTICGIGNEKNKLYRKLIKKEKVTVFESSIKLIEELRKSKIKVGLISSSKNTNLILREANLEKYFDVIVDGILSKKMKLKGKPCADIYAYAAHILKLMPGECAMVEDAISGIESGINGNFGMVIGVSRSKASLLHNADIVVSDLSEISIKKIKDWFKDGMNKDLWKLNYKKYDTTNETKREALCAIGNGYFGTRGCFETQSESENHYPGFYIAGIFNKLVTKIGKKEAINNSMVNCPNWILVKIKIADEDFINPFESEILEYEKILDMKTATLKHKLIFRDSKGRMTQLTSERFASMNNPHVAAMKFRVKPLNYSEKITLKSLIDGNVRNHNVKRYKGLKSKHLEITKKQQAKNSILLETKTNNSGYKISIACKNIFSEKLNSKEKIKRKFKLSKEKFSIGEEVSFSCRQNCSYELKKIINVYTSLGEKNPSKKALNELSNVETYEELYRKHKNSWKKIWKKADTPLEGDRHTQRVLRLHKYHLVSNYSPHVEKLDVGITARGLTGEAYHGHVFWDELFTLPFYIHHFPEVAKSALLYRYRRLNQAKEYAKSHGYNGAMFPWQSADTGYEETQTIHYNPLSGKWDPDYSRNQRHVSIMVFYNFHKYIFHTLDYKFLEDYGAEVMVEVARFWESISEYDKKTGKYSIHGVMGPDEFQEKYHGTQKALKDNAYTNVMVAWLMERMVEMTEKFSPSIRKKLNIRNDEIEKWKDMRYKMNVVVKNGVIMQFDGFDKLKDLDFNKYKEKYGNIERMDRILKKEGKSPDNYKITKQADALMLIYVLEPEELIGLLRKLGIKIRNPSKFLHRNYDYYISKTTHGSSLSRFVHGSILTNIQRSKNLWDLFQESSVIDLLDTQGGTVEEGIHMASMAGTINLVRKHLAGARTHPKGLTITPYYPEHWKNLKFKLMHQEKYYMLEYEPKKVLIDFRNTDKKASVFYGEGRKKHTLHGGVRKKLTNINLLKTLDFRENFKRVYQ